MMDKDARILRLIDKIDSGKISIKETYSITPAEKLNPRARAFILSLFIKKVSTPPTLVASPAASDIKNAIIT